MLYPRVKRYFEFDELVALGNTGLTEAAQRYDHGRGVSFATFAWYRVQGAIMDGLRRNTHLPRRTWQKLVALRAASDYLEHQSDREEGARAQGVAPPAGVDALAKIKQALSAIRTMYVTSLDTLRDEAGFDPPAEPVDQLYMIETSRLARKLAKAMAELPEREQQIVKKHYWEGKNLLEAGEEMGISKSWASRLHASAVDKLRELMEQPDS